MGLLRLRAEVDEGGACDNRVCRRNHSVLCWKDGGVIPKPGKRVRTRKRIKRVNTRTLRKRLMIKAVKVFNEYIRKRDPACFDCGSIESPTCGHLITAKKESTRFDEMNCFRQTAGHNFRHEMQPEIYTLKFIERFGAQAYADLVSRSNQIKKHTVEELQEIIEDYQRKLERL
jgi:hypothetical protein